MPAHVHVIVFDEDDLAAELGAAGKLGDALQDLLARLVLGMCFAGEDELHRMLRVVDKLRNLFDVTEDQVGPLVSRKAPSKTDGQRVQAQRTLPALDHFGRLAAPFGLAGRPAADEAQQPRFEDLMRLPKFAIIDAVGLLPDLGLGTIAHPVGPQVAVIKSYRI